jgi:hypothetical protein
MPNPKSTLSSAVGRIRAKIAEKPHLLALQEILMALQRHDHRIVAIVGGSIIEQTVESALLTHFIKDIQENPTKIFGPPQESPITFDTKIRMAYALGVFGPNTQNDITLVRHIRNLFAHTLSTVTFDSLEVAELCTFFKYRDSITWLSGRMTIRKNHLAIRQSLSIFIIGRYGTILLF